MNRRGFLKLTGGLAIAALVPKPKITRADVMTVANQLKDAEIKPLEYPEGGYVLQRRLAEKLEAEIQEAFRWPSDPHRPTTQESYILPLTISL